MRVFNISKKVWLRGEGACDSYLLRPTDQKMCCIGQVLEQLGCDRNEQLYTERGATQQAHPQQKEINLVATIEDSAATGPGLYTINDTPDKYKRPWDRIRALNRALTRVGADWRMRLVP